MGAKTWMLVYSDGDPKTALAAKPPLDRAASAALARQLFAAEKLDPLDNDTTLTFTNPPDRELVVGCYSGVGIVAAKEFALERPSRLPPRFLDPGLGRVIHLHAMHSVVDWIAFARWTDGKLERSLSVAPDAGVIEDIGTRLPFEEPYWGGDHPVVNAEDADSAQKADEPPYPLPFHPLELGDEALGAFFGYRLEGFVDGRMLDPEWFPLMRFKRVKRWWKPW